MLKVGFVGWRGMVGSVLQGRMREEGDLDGIDARYFSTSNPGGEGPNGTLLDAHDLDALAACDVVITCQGGSYTNKVYGDLMGAGYGGLWIDASSALRMEEQTTLVLDPVNDTAIRQALADGQQTFAGANCTVSLLVLGLLGLLRSGEVEWISTMTYQAASGAGAKQMTELVEQMRALSAVADPAQTALQIEQAVRGASAPTDAIGALLAGSALPWIDRAMPSGQTREEWKAQVEAARILGTEVPIDGTCVRIGAMRSHAQAFTLELKRALPMDEVRAMIDQAHPWTSVVPNEKQATLERLTPAAVSGTLQVPVGRLRPMTLGPTFLTGFTVGDQLLWGAAEPLLRTLRIVREERGR